MTSIKQVAAKAGVSTATVSRVLANKTNVSREARARVDAAVAELGYRPNLVARSLRAQRSNTIGLVVSDIRNPFFTAVGRAVEDAAYEAGYRVVICNTDENPEKEALYLALMRDENVAGVIVSPAPHDAPRPHNWGLGLPLVVIDREPPLAGLDSVVLDNAAAAGELTAHLIAHGYRRIAGLFGAIGSTGEERRQGFQQALRAHGLAPEADVLVPPRREAGEDATRVLLSRERPPEAILCGNSLLTEGALLTIRAQGLHIPTDVALAGFDETIWQGLIEPGITVLAQPTDAIGRAAIELLLARVAQQGRAAHQVRLAGTLIARGSTAVRVSRPVGDRPPASVG